MSHEMKNIARLHGFSLMELFIVVAILAIFTAAVGPNMAQFFRQQRINTQTELLNSAFRLARAEALSQARNITVCWNIGNANINRKGYTIAGGNIAVLGGGLDIAVNPDGRDVLMDVDYLGGLAIFDREGDDCMVFNSQGRPDPMFTRFPFRFVVCNGIRNRDDSQVLFLNVQGRTRVLDNAPGFLRCR